MPLLDHLPIDLEEVVLGVVEHHEEPRPNPGDLADQLRADRAARAGDEDDLVLHVGADPVELHPDRLTAEDVLHLHSRSCLAGTASEQLEHGRKRPDGDIAPAGRHHLPAKLPGADGIAMISFEASSSRTSPISSVVPSTLIRAAAFPLARIVVEEPDRA